MGSGNWTSSAFTNKIHTMGFTSSADLGASRVQEVYRARMMDDMLNPYGVMRECRDSEEHPATLPIILALDVTGSMGRAATMCASKLDEIMTELYGKVKDVEFMMMAIGDLAYDDAPIQASQFESDIRIMDQTEKIYFEGHGGANNFESYTAAWYFGLNNCDLDCWKRGKKGVIITMGDEPMNPYLPQSQLNFALGSHEQDDVDTEALYREALAKYDIYHIAITDRESCYNRYAGKIKDTWGKLLGQNLLHGKSDDLPKLIGQIVDDHVDKSFGSAPATRISRRAASSGVVDEMLSDAATPDGIRW